MSSKARKIYKATLPIESCLIWFYEEKKREAKQKMKNLLILITISVFLFGISELAEATLISFIQYPPDSEILHGVDGDTSGWSSNNSRVTLTGGGHWSLLGGTASVDGYRNSSHGTLTHRGTRGLGVFGRENDEVDSYDEKEKIEITFNHPQYLNFFEVRSLFYEPNLLSGDGRERGVVDLWLGGSHFFTQNMIGIEDIRNGTKGRFSIEYNPALIVDKVVFYVPQGEWYTYQSEFAVAKLHVEATAAPEPSSILLFSSGLIGSLIFIKKRKIKLPSASKL